MPRDNSLETSFVSQSSRNYPHRGGSCERRKNASSCGRDLQSHPPVTGVLKWEIRESALGSAPKGAPGNRGAPGGAPESAQGVWGCSKKCSQECRVRGVNRKSTLGSTPWSTPKLPEHSREHPPKHPGFREHPREHFPEHFHGFPTLAAP